MVVAGILALALALPTGALFGIGYGTGVRIGYEQIYPLLFPKGERPSPATAEKNIKAINSIYNAIGGKEASQMGIATGLASAMGELDKNPDFQDLLKLESTLSGLTQSSSGNNKPFKLELFSTSEESSFDKFGTEIDEFNQKTGMALFTEIDALSYDQIISMRIVNRNNKEWMDMSGQVLLQRTLAQTGKDEKEFIPSTSYTVPEEIKFDTTDAKKPVALAWIKKRDDALVRYHDAKNKLDSPSRNLSRAGIRGNIAIKLNMKKLLRTLSNDYRHPNNFIRTQALVLRRILQTL